MSGDDGSEFVPVEDRDIELDDRTLKRIRERVLEAEKERLHMDIARGMINETEQIIREEIN